MRPSPSAPGQVTYVPTPRIAAIRDSIYVALFASPYFHDFDTHAFGHHQSPVFHDRMHDLRLQRVAAEEALAHMLLDQTPDGMLIDPTLFSETEYKHLTTLASDLNHAMYVIYAQFLDTDPSLTYKTPPNSNLAPERDRRPYSYNEFHSPGSYEDSELEYATSRVHKILNAAQPQRESLTMEALPSTRQPPKRLSATMGSQMSDTRPHTYRRTDTNDATYSAPPPIVPHSSVQLTTLPQSPPASSAMPTRPTATRHAQSIIMSRTEHMNLDTLHNDKCTRWVTQPVLSAQAHAH
jgi:hypothetical protein